MKKAVAISCILLLLSGPMAQPIAADCCTDIWSCAAAVATGGLSCVVQGLIDTVNNLINKVNELRNKMNSLAQDTANAAQQGVNDAADKLDGQSDDSSAQQDQFLKAAGPLVAQEEAPSAAMHSKSASEGRSTGAVPAGSSTSGSNASGKISPQSSKVGASAPANVPATASSGINANAVTLAPALQPADPAAVTAEMQAALREIQARISQAKQRLAEVRKQTQLAKQQAANGVPQAQNLAQLVLAPLGTLNNWLKDLVADPAKIFDPTSIVDSTLDTITNDLNNFVDQLTAKVTSDANQSMQSAQAPYEQLLELERREKQILEAMQKLHKERTKGALDELYALVPPPRLSNSAVQMAATAAPNSQASARLTFNSVMNSLAAGRQKAAAIPKQRFQELSSNIAQLKTIRIQAKSIHLEMPNYQRNFAQRMDNYFAGKSSADATRQRDQLIAEARTHFANDPKTRDAVIKLLGDESDRRIQRAPLKHP